MTFCEADDVVGTVERKLHESLIAGLQRTKGASSYERCLVGTVIGNIILTAPIWDGTVELRAAWRELKGQSGKIGYTELGTLGRSVDERLDALVALEEATTGRAPEESIVYALRRSLAKNNANTRCADIGMFAPYIKDTRYTYNFDQILLAWEELVDSVSLGDMHRDVTDYLKKLEELYTKK